MFTFLEFVVYFCHSASNTCISAIKWYCSDERVNEMKPAVDRWRSVERIRNYSSMAAKLQAKNSGRLRCTSLACHIHHWKRWLLRQPSEALWEMHLSAALILFCAMFELRQQALSTFMDAPEYSLLTSLYFFVRWLTQLFWSVFCCLFECLSLLFCVNTSLHYPTSFSFAENKPSQICIVAGCRLRSLLICRRELLRFCRFFAIYRVICKFSKLAVPFLFSQVFRTTNAAIVRNVESYERVVSWKGARYTVIRVYIREWDICWA